MNVTHLTRPVANCTVNELQNAFPEAADVLASHGVDPRTRCNTAVRVYPRVGKVLRRNCPVDDVDATLRDLRALVGEP